MQTFLTFAFYAAIAAVFIILAIGLINMTRKDDGQASRSQQLMRMRVGAQALAIAILVAIGFISGAIKLPF